MLTMVPGCELDVERGPDWLLVRVRNLDQAESGTTPLAERLQCLMQQHFSHRLLLELDETQVLNRYLIAQLIKLYRWIEERDGVMRICGLSPHNRQMLHTCRLDDRLLPYGDRKEAVMGRLHPTRPR